MLELLGKIVTGLILACGFGYVILIVIGGVLVGIEEGQKRVWYD